MRAEFIVLSYPRRIIGIAEVLRIQWKKKRGEKWRKSKTPPYGFFFLYHQELFRECAGLIVRNETGRGFVCSQSSSGFTFFQLLPRCFLSLFCLFFQTRGGGDIVVRPFYFTGIRRLVSFWVTNYVDATGVDISRLFGVYLFLGRFGMYFFERQIWKVKNTPTQMMEKAGKRLIFYFSEIKNHRVILVVKKNFPQSLKIDVSPTIPYLGKFD